MAKIGAVPPSRTSRQSWLRHAAGLPQRASAAVAAATVRLDALSWEPSRERDGAERDVGERAIELLPRVGAKAGAYLGEALALPGRAILGFHRTHAVDGGMRGAATGGAGGALKAGVHGLLIDLPRALGIATGGIAGAALLGAALLLGAGGLLVATLAIALGLGIDALATQGSALMSRLRAGRRPRPQAAGGPAAQGRSGSPSQPPPARARVPEQADVAALPLQHTAVRTPAWNKFYDVDEPAGAAARGEMRPGAGAAGSPADAAVGAA